MKLARAVGVDLRRAEVETVEAGAAVLRHVAPQLATRAAHDPGAPDQVADPEAVTIEQREQDEDRNGGDHGWWTLFTLLRLYPDLPEAERIRTLADELFTPENVAVETAYLARPESRGFERPYGWGWLLMLAAELRRHGAGRAETLHPLTLAFAQRFKDFLPLADYPVRVGTHYNTAFALRLALNYADGGVDEALSGLCRDRALRWHASDRDCPAWEPSQDEFLSPALMEAVLMQRVMEPREFQPWFAAFLPRLSEREPATLFQPAGVSDRSDGKIAHLDGLNLSRAWCWREIAAGLDADDPRRAVAVAAAEAHLDAALPHVTGDYMGEHWLASFALLALMAETSDPGRLTPIV